MAAKILNRNMYKEVKKMDREELENFLQDMQKSGYVLGFEDGTKVAQYADFKIELVQLLNKTKGIGPKTSEKILKTLKEVKKNDDDNR